MINYSVYRHNYNDAISYIIKSDRTYWVCRTYTFKNGGGVLVDRYGSRIKVFVPFKETAYMTIDGITKDNFINACRIARNWREWEV